MFCSHSAVTGPRVLTCHPPVSMFMEFSTQRRLIPHSFHILHFWLPGGGSSLQTCRWCSPFRDFGWEAWEQAGHTCCCTHGALRQPYMGLHSWRGLRTEAELWTPIVYATWLLIHSLVLFWGLWNEIWAQYAMERSGSQWGRYQPVITVCPQEQQLGVAILQQCWCKGSFRK